MYNIKTLNKISENGLSKLDPASFTVNADGTKADAILVRSADMTGAEFDDTLLAIGRAGAGVNNIPVDRCTASGIAVFNTPGANANAVKELVICGLLLAARRIVQGAEWCSTLKGNGADVPKLVESGKNNFVGPEIAGKTLGVVGLGAIGVKVANAAAALGMKIVGFDPFLTDAAMAALTPEANIGADINELFSSSDYIPLHSPLNDQTRGTVNASTLALCPDGVRILNFARAGLVDSEAILAALASGKCAAYVTDFATDEQLGVDGVVAIPHLGASTPESEENCAVMAASEISDFLLSGKVRNSVNLPETDLARSGEVRLTVIAEGDVSDAVVEVLADRGCAVLASSCGVRKTVFYGIFDLDKADDDAVAAVAAVEGVTRVRRF